MVVLLNSTYGLETFGKCSPDHILLEALYTRQLCKYISEVLLNYNVYNVILVTEDNDISLKERVSRVNSFINKYGEKNVCLVSCALNCSNSLYWSDKRGWSINSFRRTNDLLLEKSLYSSAKDLLKDLNVKVYSDYSPLYDFKDISCPFVQTNNFFRDNKDDVKFLLSDYGQQLLVRLHVEGILRFINLNKK